MKKRVRLAGSFLLATAMVGIVVSGHLAYAIQVGNNGNHYGQTQNGNNGNHFGQIWNGNNGNQSFQLSQNGPPVNGTSFPSLHP